MTKLNSFMLTVLCFAIGGVILGGISAVVWLDMNGHTPAALTLTVVGVFSLFWWIIHQMNNS